MRRLEGRRRATALSLWIERRACEREMGSAVKDLEAGGGRRRHRIVNAQSSSRPPPLHTPALLAW
jgi:hypothetical protein